MKAPTSSLIATQDLIGPALDWAVAYARCLKLTSGRPIQSRDLANLAVRNHGSPSADWPLGAQIIESERIESYFNEPLECWAAKCDGYLMHGPTLLTACMRSFVAARLGSGVHVPDAVCAPSREQDNPAHNPTSALDALCTLPLGVVDTVMGPRLGLRSEDLRVLATEPELRERGLSDAQIGTLKSLNAVLARCADAALDEVCAQVQDVLGITTGDQAALAFSGNELRERLTKEVADYILFELRWRAQELQGEELPDDRESRPRPD